MANKKWLKWADIISAVLLIAGGLNWGLIGAFNYNLVESLFGSLATPIYWLVGLSAMWTIYMLWRLNTK